MVLIAAFSGRSLAQSARRAGYRPFVVDAFGDLDTREAAEDIRVIGGAMQTGFRTKPVIAALEDLSSVAGSKPVGLILGSGFEDKPRLVAALASRFQLLGADADTYRACKDPRSFFDLLDELEIAHPETRPDPPVQPEGWISKRIGGSGGRHIRICTQHNRAKSRRYFQRLVTGERLSISTYFTKRREYHLHWTRQWTAPSVEHPFRFGGAVSNPLVDPELGEDLETAVLALGTTLKLRGLASFDAVVGETEAYLLEVNPRPGASLDVLDDESGILFRQHIAAFLERPVSSSGMSAALMKRPNRPARAMAILHADRGDLTLGDTRWPEWSADRGTPGSFVPRGAPLATVFATGPTADAAEALARTRLAELEDLIYGHAKL